MPPPGDEKNQSQTFFPLRSDNRISLPVWSKAVKSGAGSPSLSILFSPPIYLARSAVKLQILEGYSICPLLEGRLSISTLCTCHHDHHQLLIVQHDVVVPVGPLVRVVPSPLVHGEEQRALMPGAFARSDYYPFATSPHSSHGPDGRKGVCGSGTGCHRVLT